MSVVSICPPVIIHSRVAILYIKNPELISVGGAFPSRRRYVLHGDNGNISVKIIRIKIITTQSSQLIRIIKQEIVNYYVLHYSRCTALL